MLAANVTLAGALRERSLNKADAVLKEFVWLKIPLISQYCQAQYVIVHGVFVLQSCLPPRPGNRNLQHHQQVELAIMIDVRCQYDTPTHGQRLLKARRRLPE